MNSTSHATKREKEFRMPMMSVRVESLQRFWKKHIEAAPIMPKIRDNWVEIGNGNPKLERFVERSESIANAIAENVIRGVAGNSDLSAKYNAGYSVNFKVEILGKGVWREMCGAWGHVHELFPMGKMEAWHSFGSFTSGNLRAEYSVTKDFFGKNTPLELGAITIDFHDPKVLVVFPGNKQVEYHFGDVALACKMFYRAVREFVPENAKMEI